jgi:hypothetical protein
VRVHEIAPMRFEGQHPFVWIDNRGGQSRIDRLPFVKRSVSGNLPELLERWSRNVLGLRS